jgi:OPT oligopeptide transporter protein
MAIETFLLVLIGRFEQIVALLPTFPTGKAWARFMPNISFFGISLNPGPFTIKEHVIITIMTLASDTSAYAVGTEIDKLCQRCLRYFLRHF